MVDRAAINTKARVIFFLRLSLIAIDSILRLLRKEIIIKYMAAVTGIVIIAVMKKFSSTRPASNFPGKNAIISIEIKAIIPIINSKSCNELWLFGFFVSNDKVIS